MEKKFVLAIHGGSGTILKKNMTPGKEAACIKALEEALQAGYHILENGGTSLDAVVAAGILLENSPLFNAGKGSVFTSEGRNELDASIMDGKTLKAGSVAGVTNVKNPIMAARAVMDKSDHVMMIGSGAEQFAKEQGLEIVDQGYFYIEERWQSLMRLRAQDPTKMELDHASTNNDEQEVLLKQTGNNDHKFGTIGAVALDIHGNLAAATSTGGMTNKRFGRVGDTPIIGAGTYAKNATCAVSCTGWGEFFIRLSVAKTVSDLMEYRNLSLKEATEELILKQVPELGGDGGVIAVDKNGNIALPFSTEGMYRAFKKSDGEAIVKIYKE